MNIGISEMLHIIIPVVTAVVSYFVGTRKRKNDMLGEMQKSINMLTLKNAEQLEELIRVRAENAELLRNQLTMQHELEKLRIENCQFKVEIEQLNEKLKDVKTITRKS